MQFESAFYWAKISLTIVIVFQQSLRYVESVKLKMAVAEDWMKLQHCAS